MTTTDAAGNAIYNTTDLTEGVIIDIDPMIQMLSPTDLPLLNGVGSDGRSVIAKGTCFEKKVEWQDDELLLPRSTLGAAVGTTTATVVQVAAGHRLRFQTGDVLLINDEMVRVTGYSSTANQLNVTRGFGGTTAATQSSGDVILNLGAHLSEGSDPPDARHTDWTNRYNITQIFGPTAVHLSETENTVRKYGLEGTTRFDYEASKRFKEMMIQLEQALVYGTRYEDTSNAIRQMGGATYFMTSNVDASTTNFSGTTGEGAFLDQLQACYTAGGMPDRAMMNEVNKRKVSGWASADIRLGRADNGRGQIVEYYISDFGRIDFVLNRWLRTEDILIYGRDQFMMKTLRGFQFQMLAKTGDSRRGMLVGEVTCQFKGAPHAARFSAIA